MHQVVVNTSVIGTTMTSTAIAKDCIFLESNREKACDIDDVKIDDLELRQVHHVTQSYIEK